MAHTHRKRDTHIQTGIALHSENTSTAVCCSCMFMVWHSGGGSSSGGGVMMVAVVRMVMIVEWFVHLMFCSYLPDPCTTITTNTNTILYLLAQSPECHPHHRHTVMPAS